MNEDLNKELCELLGIVWHEMKIKIGDRVYNQCLCGFFADSSNDAKKHVKENNPDFTTDSGKVQLLREIRKRDWVGLIEKIGMRYHPAYSQSRARETIYYIEAAFILDDTDKLAAVVRDFLKGQKKEEYGRPAKDGLYK